MDILLTVTKHIIEPHHDPAGDVGTFQRPPYRIMIPFTRLVPGTDFNAVSTAGPVLVGTSELRTAFDVRFPNLITVIKRLFTIRDGFGRAFPCTLPAIITELL